MNGHGQDRMDGPDGPRPPRPEDRAPPGSLLVCLLGALGGAAVGHLLRVVVALLVHPDDGLTGAVASTWPLDPLARPSLQFILPGAVAGFLLVGLLVGNRLARQVVATAGRVLVVLLGMAIGALVAVGVHVGFWLRAHPGHSVFEAVAGWQATFGHAGDRLTLFVLAGLVAGLAGATYVVGRGRFRRGVSLVSGIVAGGLAGLLAFSVATVVTSPDARLDWASVARGLARAADSGTVVEGLFALIGAYTGASLARYRWRLYGLLTFLSLVFVVLGYFLYTLTWTLPTVPPAGKPVSVLLFVAETCSLLMVLLYSFYTIDVASRKTWGRTTTTAVFSPYYLPKVAIQVPTYNEPPELVEATLRSLLALDYPVDRYIVVVGDDSTRPECSGPLRAFCKANGIAYLHRKDRTGYKAGVLNALLRWIPSDYTLLAVVDADYQVEPEFLRETVGYFVDPDLGWLQTPQDYRNRHQSFLTEQYYLADAYFYRTILPSRNEENSIIFCGTMGLLRRRAVQEVGGWGEKYITEDAEISARLLNAGWNSLYVNKTYGRGLIPATFEGYKAQHYRWAFGGGRILRGHGLRFLLGRFTFRQRLDYLVGTLNWLEGTFILSIALFVLAFGAADVAGVDLVTHHSGEVLLIGLVPIFLLLDGLSRVHLVLRRSVALTFGGTLRMLGMWSSVKFSNMRAALKGLFGFKIPFVRTSKRTPAGLSRVEALRRSIRLTPFESVFATLLGATALAVLGKLALLGWDASSPGRLFLGFWLAYYCLVFSCAPLYAYKSFATLRPGPDGEAASAAPPPAPPPDAPAPAAPAPPGEGWPDAPPQGLDLSVLPPAAVPAPAAAPPLIAFQPADPLVAFQETDAGDPDEAASEANA